MITIIAKNFIQPGKAEAFRKEAEKLVQESRREQGCLKYELNEDISDQNVLTFIEEWLDEETIRQHNSSKHFTEIVPILHGYCVKPAEVNLYRRLD